MKKRKNTFGALSLKNAPNDTFGLLSLTGGSSATPPVNTVAPSVSGTAVVGQTLTTTNGTWTNTPSGYTYQWYRGVTPIGTNSSTYVLVQADAGQNIKCNVTATNSAGSVNADSNTLAILATVLDLYTSATVAYSTRLLRGAFYSSSALRVRRSSDNTELNIGFTTAGNLDTATMLTFCGAGNGFVVTWYDQSGNANNATQSTPSNQPQIVSSGALVTVNSKVAMSFNGSSHHFILGTGLNYATSHLYLAVLKRDASARRVLGMGDTSTNAYLCTLWNDNKFYLQGATTGYITSTGTDTTTSQLLLTGQAVSATQSLYKNSSVITTSLTALSLGTSINAIGRYATNYSFGYSQEVIFYNTDKSASRTAIESNIISHYGIV